MAKPRHKRSITIARHRTSVSVEDEFWDALVRLAKSDQRSVAEVIAEIDRTRASRVRAADGPGPGDISLSAAIRLYVLQRLSEGRS
jgi:predicted DNA-binding ribbon-helix-helix protein